MPRQVVEFHGMRELLRANSEAPKNLKRAVRRDLREAAEPVRREAEDLARSSIRNIGEPWSRMRTGVTTKVVYVAPAKRGVKGRGNDPRRRPNLANLLMDRAMQPALNRHLPDVIAALEHDAEQGIRDWDKL